MKHFAINQRAGKGKTGQAVSLPGRLVRSSMRGFTLIEIMIVVALVGLLCAIAVPAFIRSRQRSQATVCINNLRQIDSAKQQWAIEMGKGGSALPDQSDIAPFFPRNNLPTNCPAEGVYDINQISNPPACTLTNVGHVLN
jgi:prepilin-type N-terminal cleavage/methylation domain-containing protein